jgi:hypothetical protein
MITGEQFDHKLLEILSNMSANQLLTIPGVYEIVAEEFNNEILESVESDRMSKGFGMV